MDYTRERALPAPRDPWAEYRALAALNDEITDAIEAGDRSRWAEWRDVFTRRCAAFDAAYFETYGRRISPAPF